MADTPLEGRCDCGAVTLTLPAPPDRINACPCDYCRRIGARWGYYPPEAVTVMGETDPYLRASKALEFRRCRICGVTTHWQWPGGCGPNTGINMNNFDPARLADVPVVVDP